VPARQRKPSQSKRSRYPSQPKHLTALRLRAATRSQLEPDLQKYFSVCDEKIGFLPNVLAAYSFDQAKLRAFSGLYNDLMLADSPLSKLEREMIAVVVSSANRYYRLVARPGRTPVVRRSRARRAARQNCAAKLPRRQRDARLAHSSRRLARDHEATAPAARRDFVTGRSGHRRSRVVFQHDQSHGVGHRHDAERGIPLDYSLRGVRAQP
jgi:uncharacterized peroxidase-related enzyme